MLAFFILTLSFIKINLSMTIFENILFDIKNVKVIDETIPLNKYVAIDLSVSHTELSKKFLENPDNFEKFILNYLDMNKAQVAFGGYNEERNLYNKYALFNDGETEERNIHIGLDIWAKAGTPVLAVLEGTVHSFNLNTGSGNYGPTIILKHKVGSYEFYTLYGHLSIESIENIEIGDTFKRAAQLGTLGDAAINGNYAPHLHFQIIIDLEDGFGDYPGVCTKSEREHFLKNCPDPNFLLKLEKL